MRVVATAVVAWWLAAAAAEAADPFRDWRDADLIFQESTSPQSSAIRGATGSRYTHLGMVRLTPAGPVVVEAAQTVSETPLGSFVGRGSGGRYSVYRVRALSGDDAKRVLVASRQYYGRPYDLFFRLNPAQIYCSELPYLAFQAVGINLGRLERFGDLNVEHVAVKALFASRWRQHPDCRAAGVDSVGCWRLMQKQQIITPLSLTRDTRLERVFSNFPGQPD